MNDSWQVQDFDKQLIGAEGQYGSEQFRDHKGRWSSLPLSTALPSQQNITDAAISHPQQPSCNVWTGVSESTWKNDVPGVVLPRWNSSNEWITPSAKLLSVDRQHLMKRAKVSRICYMKYCVS